MENATSNATTQIIKDELQKIFENEVDSELVLRIAEQIQFEWFELVIKVVIVAVGLLLLRHFVKSLFFYIRLRFDKYVRMGDLVKYNHSIIGRIKTYNLSTIVIETQEGFVRIPLSTWHNNYWTKLKDVGFDLANMRKKKEELSLEITTLSEQANDLKCKIEQAEEYLSSIVSEDDKKE